MPAPQTPPPAPRAASEAIQPALADLVAAALRAGALGPSANGSTAPAPDGLSRRLRAVCRISHDAGVPVERILVLLKAEWARAAADHPPHARRQLEERLAGLITACIATFYRAD